MLIFQGVLYSVQAQQHEHKKVISDLSKIWSLRLMHFSSPGASSMALLDQLHDQEEIRELCSAVIKEYTA